MTILLHIVILVIGFLLLIKGADLFIDGAAGIAAYYGISQMIIGLTIVAMGTSAPEAAISITSAIKGSDGLAIGNVIGSNITNVLLILGITAVIRPITVKEGTNKFELPLVTGVTVLLGVLGYAGGRLSRADGVIFLAVFAAFLCSLFFRNKRETEEKEDEAVIRSRIFLIILITAGIAMCIIGSRMIVNSATWIARTCGVSERIIGLTIVAVGTSLPELVTCIVAAVKNKSDIALGNILGSNIFNILFVLGMSVVIKPLPFDSSFFIDLGVCLFSSLLLLLSSVNKKKTVSKLSGSVFLLFFAVYYIWLFIS